MTTLQNASVTTKRTYGKKTLAKLGPQTEHPHLLEHTEQTQQQEITRTNQQKHLLQQQTSQNTHTESSRLQQAIHKHCKTCYQKKNRKVNEQTNYTANPSSSPITKQHKPLKTPKTTTQLELIT